MMQAMENTENADLRRRQLVDRAADLFDRDGYHAVNVAAVANAVGLKKATLYHYFTGKDEILFWIHEEFITLLLERAGRHTTEEPAKDALEAIMGDVLELMHTHRGHVRVFFEHHRELSKRSSAAIQTKRDAYQEIVEEIVRRGIANGEFRDIDPRLTTLAVFGMCNWAYQWYQADGRLQPREIARFFADLLYEGLAVDPSASTTVGDRGRGTSAHRSRR